MAGQGSADVLYAAPVIKKTGESDKMCHRHTSTIGELCYVREQEQISNIKYSFERIYCKCMMAT